MCKISVIIPAHNPGKYLQQAVVSALKQNMELEIVIVDDASEDDACERLKTAVLSKFGAHSLIRSPEIWRADFSVHGHAARLVIVRNAVRSGVAEARNMGVRLARGEYIAFLDADDLWESDKLKKQLAVLETGNAVLCNTARRLIRADGSKTDHVIKTPKTITLSELERDNVINCSSVVVKRDVMLAFPMERSDAAEDYLTWLKLARAGHAMAGLDEPLLLYRMTKGSKGANKFRACAMHYKSLRAAGYDFGRSISLTKTYIIRGIKKYTSKGA